ncbi:MAG: hypothetical protein CME68_10410 [Halobacteriovoraceae bacterium]|nr:hypothetical protein [Halobacteriovoraceae bacterium]
MQCTKKTLSCRLNLFLKDFYNKEMKFFPKSILAIASIIVSLLFVGKVPARTSAKKENCIASKSEAQSVSTSLKRLRVLKKENENLFDKYKNDFKAKIKISSNLFIIKIRSKTLSLRKKFLEKKHNKLRCKGPTS